MAWEYRYKVSLDLSGFSIDPSEITARIADLTPTHFAKAGDVNHMKSGATRVVKCSVWSARLHESEFLHSESDDFEGTLREILEKLRPYSDVFWEVRQTGNAYLQIAWFSGTSHSAGIIPAEVLKTCGSIGLDLDLEYFAPEATVNEPD